MFVPKNVDFTTQQAWLGMENNPKCLPERAWGEISKHPFLPYELLYLMCSDSNGSMLLSEADKFIVDQISHPLEHVKIRQRYT